MVAFLLVVLVIAVLAGLGFVYRQYVTRSSAVKAQQGTGPSAFARIAEADGKLIAIKAAQAVQREAAKAVHVVQDDIEKYLG